MDNSGLCPVDLPQQRLAAGSLQGIADVRQAGRIAAGQAAGAQ